MKYCEILKPARKKTFGPGSSGQLHWRLDSLLFKSLENSTIWGHNASDTEGVFHLSPQILFETFIIPQIFSKLCSRCARRKAGRSSRKVSVVVRIYLKPEYANKFYQNMPIPNLMKIHQPVLELLHPERRTRESQQKQFCNFSLRSHPDNYKKRMK